MDAARSERIIPRFGTLRVVLVGDVALDRYLDIDPALAEVSLETGLPVHNVTRIRPQPGGGGNVLANLAALSPAHLAAVGVCGDDGEGLELRRALEALGADLAHFLIRPDRMTFTYTKPLMIRPGRPPEELSRLDIRSRTPTPSDLEDRIVDRLGQAAAQADVVVAMDQAPDPAGGVLTRRVKSALGDLAAARPDKVFLADSRTSIADFANVRIKVNRAELARRFGRQGTEADAQVLALRWSAEIGRDVFVTLGADGIIAAGGGRVRHVPGVPVEPPIDVTGAGDTVLAWLAMALGAGAEAFEAAELANLAGSIVVKKLGTTGTAAVAEVRPALAKGNRS